MQRKFHLVRQKKRNAALVVVMVLAALGALTWWAMARSNARPPASFVAVEAGRPSAAIYWWDTEPGSVARFAASELNGYIRKMSGADVPVVAARSPLGLARSQTGVEVVSGSRHGSDGVRAPGDWTTEAGSVSTLLNDGYVVSARDNRVLLTGVSPRATLYAAYDLLNRLGVRFFAPRFAFYGPNAERVPHAATIRIRAVSVREQPAMAYRIKDVGEGWSHTAGTLAAIIDWMAKARLNTLDYPSNYLHAGNVNWDDWRAQLVPELTKRGIEVEVGGHGYDNFLPPERYRTVHPDWFPSGPNGVFDFTHPDALAAFEENVVGYLTSHPEISTFDAWPPDGATWPSDILTRFGTASNAQAWLTGQLSERLSRSVPGVRLAALAYNDTLMPPDPAYSYPPGVLVDVALSGRSYSQSVADCAPDQHGKPPSDEARCPAASRRYNDALTLWRTRFPSTPFRIYDYYRKYLWRSLPVVIPSIISSDVAYYRSLGAIGLWSYSEPGDWVTYELTHSLVAELSWNGGVNAAAIERAYISDRFGRAATGMATYFQLVEDAGRRLFPGPVTDFRDEAALTAARSDYQQAKDALSRAQVAEPVTVLTALSRNIDYALADLAVSDGENSRRPEVVAQARAALRTAVDQDRFGGSVLAGFEAVHRYDPSLTYSMSNFLYQPYRSAWP